jgi:hypothetical protein
MPAGLVTGGAGDQGRLELGRLREKEKEFEGNSRGCLPWWEKDGRWPPAVGLADEHGLTAEVALRCSPGRGKQS